MTSFKKYFKEIEWQHLVWRTWGWFLILFGIADYFFLHRLVGLPIIVGGILTLIVVFMIKHKLGPFKPQPKTKKVLVDDKGVTSRDIMALIIMVVLGITIIYFAWNWHINVEHEIKQNCKVCSVFQKDCPYTDKELNEQEYGNGPCNDMGTYEMLWKFSAYATLMGFIPIFIGIAGTIPWLRNKIFVQK